MKVMRISFRNTVELSIGQKLDIESSHKQVLNKEVLIYNALLKPI